MNAAAAKWRSATRRFCRLASCALLVGAPAAAGAQSDERPPLGGRITTDELGRLPAAGNLLSLIDAAVPEVIGDRVDTGGWSAGDPARLGARGSSWTQTLFTVGDVDITDASGRGTPLLLPGTNNWRLVDVATGLLPIERNAPGLAITLVPRAPSTLWSGSVWAAGSPPGLTAKSPADLAPPIARLNSWAGGNVAAGGPIRAGTLGMFASIEASRATHFERASPASIDGSLASGFLTVTATPQAGDELRLVGWLQRTRGAVAGHIALAQPNAAEKAVALHTQTAWDHVLTAGGASLHAFAGFTERRRANELSSPAFIAVDRLQDGPIPNLLDAGPGRDQVLSAGVRANGALTLGALGRHVFTLGSEATGASTSTQSTFTGTVGELVDGIPARVWRFIDPPSASRWRSTGMAAYINDDIAVHPRLTLNGGLRFDAVAGARGGEDAAIKWANVLPRAGAHWLVTNFWQLTGFGQYDRYAYRLPLGALAHGDPTAPTGEVFRWNAPVGTTMVDPAALGPLVQRVGPGSGGDPRFSAIDPGLRRPTMEELILGFELKPSAVLFLRASAIGRREQHLLGVVDVGVPTSTYTTVGVHDQGLDVVGGHDDQLLMFYNRSPATFGQDRYLVTNPAGNDMSFVGAEISARFQGPRSFFFGGITAGRSEALAATRGFGPLEDDQGLLGELYVNPNAAAFARLGRVFTERGYTIKAAGSRQFSHDLDLGLVVRYQDGQHFSRMVVLDGLNQGAEAIRAFPNGKTRFTFTMTVDARLQKGLTLGGRRMVLMVDAYNVLNLPLEFEEFTVSGPKSRTTSAIQPPLAIHVGFRLPL